MAARCGFRVRGWRPGLDTSERGTVQIQRIAAPGGATSALLGGLHPDRLGTAARAATLAELGSVAGNSAVAGLVARVRTDMPADPPGGVREIRAAGGGGTLGHTRSLIDPSPPIFRLPPPETTNGRSEVRPSRARVPEMDFEVRYPTAGRHLLYEGTTEAGESARIWLNVTDDWSATILRGEEEHVEDQAIAWRDTWEQVAGVINDMADGAPTTASTPEEARRAAWRRFVNALPSLLRPTGEEPSDGAQLAKWGLEERESVFRRLVGESKRARDLSGWHTPDSSLDHMDGADEVRVITEGSSRIGVTSPEDLMHAAWTRLGGRSGRGGRGGSAG